MKFFLDTANLDEIRKGVALGVVDGVTTNPTLVAKEGRDFHDTILEIAGIVRVTQDGNQRPAMRVVREDTNIATLRLNEDLARRSQVRAASQRGILPDDPGRARQTRPAALAR